MDQPQQSERTRNSRRYQRYELETELKAVILGAQHREMRGRSLNINEGGIAGVFVITTVPIRVKGIVRNCTGYRYGFEFADLTAQERETITRTCKTLDMLE
jgi:c-di-GMP-binding flagellar brake protein YcgR